MNALPSLLTLCTICAAMFAALMLYRSHLTRHEVDQVFLNDSIDHHLEEEHEEIVRRVASLRPLVQGTGGAAAVLGVATLGVYLTHILPNVRF